VGQVLLPGVFEVTYPKNWWNKGLRFTLRQSSAVIPMADQGLQSLWKSPSASAGYREFEKEIYWLVRRL
jgi:hypothetical protein